MNLNIRQLNWPGDAAAVNQIDASYSTNSTFRVEKGEWSFTLSEANAIPAYRRDFEFADLALEVRQADHSIAAISDGNLIGISALNFQLWNRRAVLSHLYVNPDFREKGVGSCLLDEVMSAARILNARCLWAETQNTNAPAIRFYLKRGFRLCGLDLSLYDPQQLANDEVAVYFAMDLPIGGANSR